MKSLVKSKTFWTGIGSVVIGVGMIVKGDMPTGAQLIVTELVAIFLRDGIRKASS